MTVNFPGTGGVSLPNTLGGRRADVPAVNNNNNTTQTSPEPKTIKQVEDIDLEVAEQRRFEKVEQASQQFFRDFFAVSDTTFSIYKDISGQYITRFTSLRDGSVTYIPEPELLQYLEGKRAARDGAIVQIEA